MTEPTFTFHRPSSTILHFSTTLTFWKRLYIILVDIPLAPVRLLLYGEFWLWRVRD